MKYLIVVLVALFALQTFNSLASSINYQQFYDEEAMDHLREFVKNNNKSIWITNPIFALESDNKIGQILYYFPSSKLIIFLRDAEKPEFVIYSDCDMKCAPEWMDTRCKESRKALDEYLNNFYIAYQKDTENCNYKIYQSIS